MKRSMLGRYLLNAQICFKKGEYIMATIKEVQECIKKISTLAIENYKNSKVLPSLVIAQSCWESGYLTSELAKNAYNPFGIKYNQNICSESYNYKGSKWCKFKSYKEAVESQGKFYNLYSRYSGIVGETDIDKVLVALEQSGYCESKGYSDSIRKMITQYDLTEYDKEALKCSNSYDEMDVSMDSVYQKALVKLMEKQIITQDSWKKSITNKHTVPLVSKTCKYLYGVGNYQDGVNELKRKGVISSDIWYSPEDVKATHLRSFIIKVEKIL